MTSAQVAWVFLTAAFLTAGTVLFLLDAEVAGALMLGVAVLGYLMLTGMIISTRNDVRSSRTTP